MYGREDVDPQFRIRQPLVHRPTVSSNSQVRRIDSRDTAYQRILNFSTGKVPKLTKVTLVNNEI